MILFVFFLPAFKNISSKLAMHGVTVGGDYRWVQISGICVFGERRSCVSQGHYNSLRSHHSYGCFLPAGLGFWRSDVGLVCEQNQGWMNVSISIYCGCSWKHVVKTAPLLSYWWNPPHLPHPAPSPHLLTLHSPGEKMLFTQEYSDSCCKHYLFVVLLSLSLWDQPSQRRCPLSGQTSAHVLKWKRSWGLR